MTTTDTASEGWLHLWGGMPAGVAIDWMMDATGSDDRLAAYMLLREAAAEWLNGRRPDEIDGAGVVNQIRIGNFEWCLMDLGNDTESSWQITLRQFYGSSSGQPEGDWLKWADDAERAVTLLKETEGAVPIHNEREEQ